MNVKEIKIQDFDYPLPQHRIAFYPKEQRDDSLLLLYKTEQLRKKHFKELPQFLDADCALVFNETRVFQARLEFFKETGARIEVFLLEPVMEHRDMQLAFAQKAPVQWKCFVGNAKKWKNSVLTLDLGNGALLNARKGQQEGNAWLVEFDWTPPELSFSEVVERCGLVPLPPYIERKAIETDRFTYQTVYAREEGSVAAPTAGLHFTPAIFDALKAKGIRDYRLTLHVGAGTFKPVSAKHIGQHEMHNEQITIPKQLIQSLRKEKKIIPVGTTSVRSLESLYWFAVQLAEKKEVCYPFQVNQWEPYESHKNLSAQEALEEVLAFMEKHNLDALSGYTRLMIVPGYIFHFAHALITNFHQPKSTLLLLVSALIGNDWRKAYDFALNEDFRFLSYGDSCLFFNGRM